MLDKQARNILFPGQRVNFSSIGPDTPHFQNSDIATSSYFIDMDIIEEISKKRKFISLDNKDNSSVSPIICGNNQFYDKDVLAVGQQQPEFGSINKLLLSNLRPAYFQQKEPSLYQETYKEELANLRDFERVRHARQLEQSGYQSENGFDLLSTFLLGQGKQQDGVSIPHLPVVVESSSSEQACLEREKLKNNAYVSKELESIYFGKQDALTNLHNNQSLVERSLYINTSLNSERFSGSSDGFSANMDEQNKPTNCGLSPVISEKIWEGSLKLNTSTTVSAVAFFKSGAKVEDLNWPDHLEIKGKVRLNAFEKFIQELPRSRNRALMVISLCWKLGSCQGGLADMMEIAKGYRESEKVGFAQIPPGIDLYVCPRSDIIITILAKYGFFKGMAAVEEDRDSLIGCVVWRRGQSSANSVCKTSAEEKKALIQEQPLKSTELSIQGMNSPMEACVSEKKQVMPSEIELKAASDLPGFDAARDIAMANRKYMITESKAAPSSSNSHHASTFHSSTTVQTVTSSIPYSSPLVPTQQNTYERPSLNLLQENMSPAAITPLAENSGMDKAVIVSDSWTQFVSPPQMAPIIVHENSLSSSTSQSLGMFGSGPGPGPRPLIPVDSSNFQFQPQVVQKTHSSLLGDGNTGSDSSCSVKNPAPSFPTSRPPLPGPPPLPIELLQSLIQSKKNSIINERMLHDEIHTMHHIATRGPMDDLEIRAPTGQIQDNYGGSNDDNDNDDDEDDLPEFDFNSACEEQPDAPMSRLPGFSQQSHFPFAAPPFNEKRSFEAANSKSFESFQHRHKLSPIPRKLLNSNEGLNLVENFGENISKRTPSTEAYQLTHRRSSLKEEEDLGSDQRHGFGFKHKSLWDDDDMPEWCPPDLELPELPRLNATENARLLSGRTLPPPTLSFHPSRSQDLPQVSRPGLLGPCPSSDAPAGGFIRSAKPPLGPLRTDSFRPRASKFKFRRPSHYDTDHKRRRRHRR